MGNILFESFMKKISRIIISLLCILILSNIIIFCKTLYERNEQKNLILVNVENPLPEEYSVDLSEITEGVVVADRIEKQLVKMIQDAEDDGVYLKVVSGYRTMEEQHQLYVDEIQLFLDEGYTKREAENMAKQWVAVPGTSEHQTGLAVDINAIEDKSKREEVYIWLAYHAQEYGFIRRYPPDKVDITGIANEPWHYRYVGKKAAIEMKNENKCLEEYIGVENGRETR